MQKEYAVESRLGLPTSISETATPLLHFHATLFLDGLVASRLTVSLDLSGSTGCLQADIGVGGHTEPGIGVAVGVAVTVGGSVGDCVGVTVTVGEIVRVLVCVGVMVGVMVGVWVRVFVGVLVPVAVGVL